MADLIFAVQFICLDNTIDPVCPMCVNDNFELNNICIWRAPSS